MVVKGNEGAIEEARKEETAPDSSRRGCFPKGQDKRLWLEAEGEVYCSPDVRKVRRKALPTIERAKRFMRSLTKRKARRASPRQNEVRRG